MLEKRTHMHLPNLRSRIEAMGGELNIIARFSNGMAKIGHASGLGSATEVAGGDIALWVQTPLALSPLNRATNPAKSPASSASRTSCMRFR